MPTHNRLWHNFRYLNPNLRTRKNQKAHQLALYRMSFAPFQSRQPSWHSIRIRSGLIITFFSLWCALSAIFPAADIVKKTTTVEWFCSTNIPMLFLAAFKCCSSVFVWSSTLRDSHRTVLNRSSSVCRDAVVWRLSKSPAERRRRTQQNVQLAK